MFKLFRKARQAFQPKIDVNTLVAEIHNDFDTATERLLNEAKEILSKGIDTAKGEQLRSLGFTSSKPSVDSALDIKQKQDNEQLANHIEYYQTYYPNNKFITELEVEKICKKYGLLSGGAEYYTGDVPDKNVKEIASFKLRDEDCTKYECGYFESHHTNSGYRCFISSVNGKGKYGYLKNDMGWGRMLYSISDTEQKFHYEKPTFKICASVKDFDMNKMRVTDGYKLEQNIPDPIVLQPVNGGYLIISKWGLEASDESLVNEKLN